MAGRTTFYKRALLFLEELKRGSFPNATRLAELASISPNTAQRTIDRLRTEFQFPIEYVKERHGYRLLSLDFSFAELDLKQDELTVLILLRDVVEILDCSDLKLNMNRLWDEFATTIPDKAPELETLAGFFSTDLSSLKTSYRVGLLELLRIASEQLLCEVTYRSPWSENQSRSFTGYFIHLRYMDGTLYALFETERGNIVLNCARIEHLKHSPRPEHRKMPDKYIDWPEGFGIWSSDSIQKVQIRILPPASRYYADEQWHFSQSDRWDGTTLVRTFRSAISPELVRRILSIGRFVERVEPQELSELVKEEIQLMSSRFHS